MRYLSLLLAALIAGCVPAAGPKPATPSLLARVDSIADAGGFAGAFPEPLTGWSAAPPEEGPGVEEGSTALRRAYTKAGGGVLSIFWILDSPRAAAAVAAVGKPDTSGRTVVVATRTETMEIAVDDRTVLKLQGAGLTAQLTYFALMQNPDLARAL